MGAVDPSGLGRVGNYPIQPGYLPNGNPPVPPTGVTHNYGPAPISPLLFKASNAVAVGGACAGQTGSGWLSIAGNIATAGAGLVPVVGNAFAAFQDIKHGNYWFAALDVGSILGDEFGAGEAEAEARVAANLAADAEKARAAEAEANAAKDVAGSIAGGKLAGFTKHGLNQAIDREGVGVSSAAMLDAVKNPEQVVAQSGGRIKYIGKNATVVTNADGNVVSTWARNGGGTRFGRGK